MRHENSPHARHHTLRTLIAFKLLAEALVWVLFGCALYVFAEMILPGFVSRFISFSVVYSVLSVHLAVMIVLASLLPQEGAQGGVDTAVLPRRTIGVFIGSALVLVIPIIWNGVSLWTGALVFGCVASAMVVVMRQVLSGGGR